MIDDPDQIARLTYLVLLGAVIGGFFLWNRRQSLNATLLQAATWLVVFLFVMAGYGLWQGTKDRMAFTADAGGEATVLRRAEDGHFYVEIEVNGTPVEFVVDTGATLVVLSREDARAIGLDPEGLRYFGRATTANGEVRTAPIRLEIMQLGPARELDVRAAVNEGALDTSLLGNSYLDRFRRIEIEGDRMRLVR